MNSTDATVGRPIVERVQLRQQELAKALAALPPEHSNLRQEIQLALDTVAGLLPADLTHVPSVVMRDLNAWLEGNKYLAENAGA